MKGRTKGIFYRVKFNVTLKCVGAMAYVRTVAPVGDVAL